MLSYIKGKIKGWVAWVIVVIIVIPFALFGIGQYLTVPSDVVIASLEGEDILKSDYLSVYERTKSIYKKNLGDRYSDKIDATIRQNAIQEVLRDKILVNYAKGQNIAVTNKELKENIFSLKDFQGEDKQFSLERYQTVLRLNGLSEPVFEARQRNLLIKNQFLQTILESDFILSKREKIIIDLLNEQRKFSYVEVDAKQFIAEVLPKEADIKKSYEDNIKLFIEPKKAKVAYISLSSEDLEADIEVPEDELLALYEEEKDNLATSEQRKASHILIEDEALAKTVLAKVRQGDSFEDLAKQHSQDTGSKDIGGDLGFFSKGVMVESFEDKAFSLNKGEVSELVQSEFGYHIIKLIDIEPAQIPSFESVKDQLSKRYKENKTSELLYQKSEELANAAYGDIKLSDVAKEFNLPLKTVDFFSKNETGKEDILTAKFIEQAFSEGVYEQSENSDVFEPSEGVFIVLGLLEKTQQRQKTFAEVKGDVTVQLIQELAQDISLEVSDKLKEFADSQQTDKFAKTIKDYKLQNKVADWIDRKDRKVANGLYTDSVFGIKKPSKGKTSTISQKTKQGSVFISLSDSRIKKPDTKDNFAQQVLVNARKQSLSASIIQLLTEDKDYKIIEGRL